LIVYSIHMFTQLEILLTSLVNSVPLEIFVFVASFVEEIVAPIPSPAVMLAAGLAAEIQEKVLLALIPLAIIGALGKTCGALVVYIISDKAEDLVMRRFAPFFNVTHEDVETFGKKLGNGARDYFLMTFLRALPFIPSVVLSVGSGLLKVPLPLFIISTFLGTIVRDGFYLYAGYVGTSVLLSLVNQTGHLETYVEVVAGIAFIYVCSRIIRKKRSNIQEAKVLGTDQNL
jgi:membrane protein DedA with SNARE-associated domain